MTYIGYGTLSSTWSTIYTQKKNVVFIYLYCLYCFYNSRNNTKNKCKKVGCRKIQFLLWTKKKKKKRTPDFFKPWVHLDQDLFKQWPPVGAQGHSSRILYFSHPSMLPSPSTQLFSSQCIPWPSCSLSFKESWMSFFFK